MKSSIAKHKSKKVMKMFDSITIVKNEDTQEIEIFESFKKAMKRLAKLEKKDKTASYSIEYIVSYKENQNG